MKRFAAALALTTIMAASPAFATDYLTIAAGGYNALRDNQNSFLYGAEYRFEPVEYGIRPMVGVFGNTDSGAYGYAGIQWDVALLPNELFISPNFAVGAYHQGDSKRLGGALEFRSGIEIAYQFPNQQRLGVALNHISNASIYDHNPGEENVIATYSLPTGNLLK